MVRSLVALLLRRVLAWLVWNNKHAKDLEIVVLRHQLQVLRRQVGRPRFRWSDRLFLAAASRRLARETWRAFLVTPQTGNASDRAPLAPRTRSMEVVPRCRSPAGPTGPRRGDAGADSPAGSRESSVGISADSRGIGEARPAGFRYRDPDTPEPPRARAGPAPGRGELASVPAPARHEHPGL
jgi:hypothetical protein